MRKDHRTLRRRPLFTPVWLSVIGAVIAALIIFWLWGMAGSSTVILVRHAEKQETSAADPALSPAGTQRAQALARLMQDVPLARIYVSEFRRTRETAAPIAATTGSDIVEIAADDVDALVARLLESQGQTVLVVAHSDTLPRIVAGLGGEITPVGDDEYSRLLIVTTGRLLRARVLSLRYAP